MHQSEEVKVIFIRHGESRYNKKAEELRNKLGIGATWEEYLASPEFMEFKYSEDMLDCYLSEQGVEQCEKQKGKYQDVDLVLVSPLYRALSTCRIIFEGYTKGPIIVQPILSQSLRSPCDISCNLTKGKLECPNFDFSLIEGKQGSWYIQNQTEQKQKIYEAWLLQNSATSYEDRAKWMNEYFKQTLNFQNSFDLIKRSQKIKLKLKEYASKFKSTRIAVVSHYYTISYVLSDTFDEKGKPNPKVYIDNAMPYEYIVKKQ